MRHSSRQVARVQQARTSPLAASLMKRIAAECEDTAPVAGALSGLLTASASDTTILVLRSQTVWKLEMLFLSVRVSLGTR